MAFEGSRKFIIPVTLRIKCHVKDDQPGAGIAQLIDELCVDCPRPGESLAIFCNTAELRTSFRAYLIQLLRSFIDAEKNEIIMHFRSPRFAFQGIAKGCLIRPDTIGKDDVSKHRCRNDCAGAKRADQREHQKATSAQPMHAGCYEFLCATSNSKFVSAKNRLSFSKRHLILPPDAEVLGEGLSTWRCVERCGRNSERGRRG